MPYRDKDNNVCGFLDIEEKEGSNIFQRRFFMLDRRKNILECYMDNPLNLTPGAQAVNQYNLQFMSIVGDAKRIKPKEQHPFYFIFAGKNICLRAGDSVDKEEWIDVLKEAAKVVVGRKRSVRSTSVDNSSSSHTHNNMPTEVSTSDSYLVEVYGDMVFKTDIKRCASDSDMAESRYPENTGHHFWDPFSNQQLIIRKGYGIKQGQIRKSWKRRYFELTPIALSYYKDEEEKVPIKDIALADVIEARMSVGIHLNKDHVFEVVTSKRVYYVQVETAGERDSWIRAVNQCVDKLRRPRPKWNEVESQTEDSVLSLSRCSSLPNHLAVNGSASPTCRYHGSRSNNKHQSYPDACQNCNKRELCDCPENASSSVLSIRL